MLEEANTEKEVPKMELTLTKNKVTPNGKVRYGDADNHNIYLTPEEVKSLAEPQAIKVTISKT